MVLPITLALLGVLVVMLVVGWRRGRFGLALAAAAAVLLGLWGASLLAFWTDYRDADGSMDCWPNCTAYQDGVGAAFWYSIPALVLLTVACALAVGVSARRRREARPPE